MRCHLSTNKGVLYRNIVWSSVAPDAGYEITFALLERKFEQQISPAYNLGGQEAKPILTGSQVD